MPYIADMPHDANENMLVANTQKTLTVLRIRVTKKLRVFPIGYVYLFFVSEMQPLRECTESSTLCFWDLQ